VAATGKREVPVPPTTRADVISNAVGIALNGGVTAWGALWLALHWGPVRPTWYALVPAVLIALFLADFVSGLLHWTFDTWLSEDTPMLRRVVLVVREHHVYPQHIFRYVLRDEAGTSAWPSLAYTVPAIGGITLLGSPDSVLGYCAVLVTVIVSTLTMFMLQFHKLGHRKSESAVVRTLQRMHLLMSPQHHGRHHRDNHDVKYCLINGWADHVMDFIGFWRGAEWTIRALTRVAPRANDVVWMNDYRRWENRAKDR
jgi:hypothetical protein